MASYNILVVGGGIGGMASAVALTRAGHKVELIDIDPQWRVSGAGITITGPTLRAYKQLGLLEEIKSQGAVTTGERIYRYDGEFLVDMDKPVLEEGLPATGGIMRPVLHHIMQKQVNELGVTVRLGLTVDGIEQRADAVDVAFSNGDQARFDLVVGADGIASKVRSLAFPGALEPKETGQACWRIAMRRPPGFERGEFYLGHANPAGITACGPDSIYMWMLTRHEPGAWLNDEDAFDRLREEIRDFGGTIAWIRDNMTKEDWINYRPLAAILQPAPWMEGRVVLVGDAAHATTPHLASGAGMAVEDALVLAEELDAEGKGIPACLAAYSARRYPRCADVVKTSVSVGQLQLDGGSPEQVGGLIGTALHRLAEHY
ncbi:FAD-dependent monooxygenase [Novosphingobium sp.]|uniref:FAD-dependent monooxygenase n=1 Tax=Novosphingobium sp. TaxID=1874826 RepID=UPI002FDF31A1